MNDLFIIIWAVVSVSTIVGYICWVNATLDKIWDDETLSFEKKRDRVHKEQQEIASIGICMTIPFFAILFGLLVATIIDLMLR